MFKGCHFPSEIILETIRYYLAYKLSYREIEEIQRERGVNSTRSYCVLGEISGKIKFAVAVHNTYHGKPIKAPPR